MSWPFEEELGPDPEYKGNWEVTKVRCRCGSRHVSVHPAICTRLECPKCHRWVRLG